MHGTAKNTVVASVHTHTEHTKHDNLTANKHKARMPNIFTHIFKRPRFKRLAFVAEYNLLSCLFGWLLLSMCIKYPYLLLVL